MAGRPGRSGGWNKLTSEQHRIRGTRPRVVRRPATLTATTTPTTQPVPPDVVAGLETPGRTFVEALWGEFQPWAGADRTLLRQAARCLDDAENATTPSARQSAIRLFAALVAQLRLKPAVPAATANPLEKFLRREIR
jgi:hypothetical protein